MERNAPLVSIGLPVYNSERYLAQTIESVINQSYRNIELIIVDDCSTDGSAAVARRYSEFADNIHFFENSANMGLVRNFRRTFRLSRGELFCWVGDHDTHEPAYIERLVEVLLEQPSVKVAYAFTRRMDDEGRVVRVDNYKFDTIQKSCIGRLFATAWNGKYFGNMIYGVFRREALEKAGVHRMVLLPDVLVFQEIAIDGEVAQVDEALWSRRFVGSGGVQRQRRTLFGGTPPRVQRPIAIAHIMMILRFRIFGRNGQSIGERIRCALLLFFIPLRQVRWRSQRVAKKLRYIRKNWRTMLLSRLDLSGGRLD